MPSLLVQAAEARMVLLQTRERAERVVWAPQVPLRHGYAEQDISLIGSVLEHRLSDLECLAEFMLPDECAQPLRCGGVGRLGRRARVHKAIAKKKGG